MQITKIEVQKRNKNRVNLYLDDEFFCGLSLETVMRNHLKEGQQVSEQNIEYLKNETEKQVALEKATGYIAKCQKTKKQINDYLLKKGFEEDIVEYVLEKLGEYHFVDDELFAKNYVKAKSKSCGKRKLEYELKHKGVEEQIISDSIENFCEDEKTVVPVLEKYLKNKPLDLKTKQKAFRFLMSHGYSSDVASAAISRKYKFQDLDSEIE